MYVCAIQLARLLRIIRGQTDALHTALRPLVADWMTPPGASFGILLPRLEAAPPRCSDLARLRVGFLGPLDCGVWTYGLCR